jgi:ParB/RepB/Spo0J family partition protein
MQLECEQVAVADVLVGERHRPIDEEAVQALMRSIAEIGLKTPISVRFLDEAVLPNGTLAECVPLLVAGRHRLEAVRRLGWTDMPAVVVEGDERDARLWEIAENLHRSELTALERSEHIAEWEKLVSAKLAETPREGRPGGKAATARSLNVSEAEVNRAAKISKLSDEAKAAAREVGLDDNQSALLAGAAKPAGEQANTLRRWADTRPRPRPAEPAPSATAPAPEPHNDAEAPEAEEEGSAEGRQDEVGATTPPAAPDEAAAPDVPSSVAALLAQAKAAGKVRDENHANLPDHESLGISKAEWKRREAARKAYDSARFEQSRLLAQAVAEHCRPFAADLLDALGGCYDFVGDLTEALEDIVYPGGEEEVGWC